MALLFNEVWILWWIEVQKSSTTVPISSSLAHLSSKIKALKFLAPPSSREIDYLLRPASLLTVQQQPPTNNLINMVKCLWRVPVESNSLSHPSLARFFISKRLPLFHCTQTDVWLSLMWAISCPNSRLQVEADESADNSFSLQLVHRGSQRTLQMCLSAVSAYWAFDLYVFEQTDALFISECAEGSPCFMLLKIDGNNAHFFANTTTFAFCCL